MPLSTQFNSSLEYMPDLSQCLWQGCALGWLRAVVSAQVEHFVLATRFTLCPNGNIKGTGLLNPAVCSTWHTHQRL